MNPNPEGIRGYAIDVRGHTLLDMFVSKPTLISYWWMREKALEVFMERKVKTLNYFVAGWMRRK